MRNLGKCGRGGIAIAALCFAAALIGGGPAHATDSARALHERGLGFYEAGDYESAIDAFGEVLASGVDDAAVHYNLGNARFKAGRLGFAIFHYRRALALTPRDQDVRANLDYARFLALDSIDEQARTDTKVQGWLDRVTAEEVIRLPGLLWILAGVAAVAWQLAGNGRQRWGRAVVVLLVAWAGALVLTTVILNRATRLDEAVVLARETTVRNGPGDTFETAFLLHEGAEVVVEGERGSWTEISLPGDLRGWIATDQIGRL